LQSRKNEANALQPLLIDDNNRPILNRAELIKSESGDYWKVPVNAAAGLYYLDLESDPATRIIQADSYRELLLRQRINKAALANMPAYAAGADLDHLASRYGIYRLTVSAATNETPAVFESDDAFRRRLLLTIEGYATGGSLGWYLFNTLSASGEVKDARILSPEPGYITVVVLSNIGDGTASPELIDTVNNYLQSRHIRPLGDFITVQSAEIVTYALDAQLVLYTGPSAAPVIANAEADFAAYRQRSERIGHKVSQSGIYDALHQSGSVYDVVINSPVLPLDISEYQAPFCAGLNLSVGYV
jgi:phage-related baseplate assembly protein